MEKTIDKLVRKGKVSIAASLCGSSVALQKMCLNKMIKASMHRSAVELLEDRFSHLKGDPDILPIDLDAAQMDAIEYMELPKDVLVNIVNDEPSIAACENAFKDVNDVFVGLDVEWPPFHGKGQIAQATLFQVAIPSCVFLFDLQTLLTTSTPSEFHDRIDAVLLRILTSPTMTKLGYGFAQDLKILRQSFPTVQAFCCVSPIIDLSKLADRLCVAASANVNGLKRLVQFCCGETMNKLQQCSPWAQRPLSAAQIDYAALDAHVLITTFNRLREMCSGTDFTASCQECTASYTAPRPAIKNRAGASTKMEIFSSEVAVEIHEEHIVDLAKMLGVNGIVKKREDAPSDATFVKTLAIVTRQTSKKTGSRSVIPCIVLIDEKLRCDMRSFSKLMVGRSRKSAMAFPQQLVPFFGISNCVERGGLTFMDCHALVTSLLWKFSSTIGWRLAASLRVLREPTAK